MGVQVGKEGFPKGSRREKLTSMGGRVLITRNRKGFLRTSYGLSLIEKGRCRTLSWPGSMRHVKAKTL